MSGSPDMDVYLPDERLTPEQLVRRLEAREYYCRESRPPQRRTLWEFRLFGYEVVIRSTYSTSAERP